MAARVDDDIADAVTPALQHVLGRLAVLEARARAAAAGSAAPRDAGAAVEAAADKAGQHGAWLPLRDLSDRLGLSDDDIDLLLAAAAPQLDPRVADALDPGRHDGDPSGNVRSWVVLHHLGRPGVSVHRLLDPQAPLVATGLVEMLAGHRIRVPQAVVEHLLMLPARPGPALAAVVAPTGSVASPAADRIAAALRAGLRFCYLQDVTGGLAAAHAASALAAVGYESLHLDLAAGEPDPAEPVDGILGEALVRGHLTGSALIIGPAASLLTATERLVQLAAGQLPVVLYGPEAWEPSLLPVLPWQLTLASPTAHERVALWRQALAEPGPGSIVESNAPPVAVPAPRRRGATAKPGLDDHDVERSLAHLHLSPAAIYRSVLSARLQSLAESRPVAVADLVTAARSQSGARLQRLARRISPKVGWADLVVPAEVVEQLQSLCIRARQRDLVLGEWKVGGSSARRRGTVALFGGKPGTGKSLAAEVIAAELGLELYQVNLATVVDKYVGETEKNLDRIFTAAEGVNCLLFFDEADALFGKRSEVKDAQDKYANVEVAYLLQRLEDFDGVAVLASNLRGNLDDAFKRRIDLLVDFPVPDAAARVQLWRTCLGPNVTLADDVDLQAMAAFDFSGGDIRNAAVGAAIAAADEGTPIGMIHLVRAAHTEYLKLGRLDDAAEFAPYRSLLQRAH